VRALAPLAAAIALISLVNGNTRSRAGDENAAPLPVCLNEELPPFSQRTKNSGAGFDFLIAQALAKRLGRPLAVQWYESKLDADASSTADANALLSDQRCALFAGYPLTKDALGKPGLDTARLPDFAGARPVDRRRRVTLGTLTPTTPYHFAGLTVVLAAKEKDRLITNLADLDGLNLTIEAGTLGDAILMSFDHGRLVPRIAHVRPGRSELLPRLEQGEADATLIPVHRFDAYRIEHPDTKLVPSGFYLSIGFNMGFVGLASEAQLLEKASAAIEAMLREGELPVFAAAAGMTYLPPRQPYILDHLTMSDLAKQ
jgi:Bacterial extracellular solute-binding proteins, family 3